MKFFRGCYRVHSFLTNGKDDIEIVGNRYGCSITPPKGMTFSILDGQYYINGKKAWVTIRAKEEECETNEA